jgi:crotonobetainyl-CoA:carnitine CoA-transferase CaiB-like acyl-CoA transferase
MSDDFLFAGLKVLDVGSWIAGPVAATILADYGADVIKIESPGDGDPYRQLSATPSAPDADVNYMWQMDGRNKRSLALNLKTPEGMAILKKLVSDCDVYITNQPFPMRRKLGLGYEDLKPLNPGMIFASLTAYGEQGPDSDREGFDLVAYWARTGLMDLVRAPGAPPAQGLPGMGDHPSAVALYASIVTALLKRERTGEGSLVHTSLLANGLWSMACIAQGGFAGGQFDRYRATKATPQFVTTLYRTSDDRWLQFSMIRGPDDLIQLFDTLGLGSIIRDARFSTPEARLQHGTELVCLVQDVLIMADSDDWLARFKAAGVNANRVGIVEETLDDEMLKLNNMVVAPTDGDMGMPWVVNHPINAANVPQVGPKRAPDVGEHSRQILQSLGYDDAQIDDLLARGVI